MAGNISFLTDTLLRETCGQITVEWEVKNFSDLANMNDCYINSDSFLLSDAQWYIELSPNGQQSNQPVGWTCLYLFKYDSSTDVHVSYTLGIKKTDGSIYESFDGKNVFKKEDSEGCGGALRLTQLLESVDVLTPDGSLIIICCLRHLDVASSAVEVVSQALMHTCDETLSDNFKELYLSGCQADIFINVKGKQFKAHKSVLVARSPVFRSMFETDMVEKNDNAVNITDCEPDSFQDFLLFLYSGKLDIVTSKNALELYSAADKYDVRILRTLCVECLKCEISVDSVCDVLRMAVLYNEIELLNSAKDFFINNAENILTTPKWLSFMADHLTLANELFVQVAKLRKK